LGPRAPSPARSELRRLGGQGGGEPGEQDVESAFEFGGAVVGGQDGGEAAQQGELAAPGVPCLRPRGLGEPVVPYPRSPRTTGSPRSAGVMGRAGGAAGLPAVAVALDDGGDIFGADAMKMQVKAAGKFPPARDG
jgi:hypothetical protein